MFGSTPPPPPHGVITNWYASLTIPLAFYGYYGQPDYSFIALIYISVVLNCQEIAGYELIKSGCLLSRIPVKTEISKFFIIMQLEKNPLVRHFGKSCIKVSKELSKPMGKKSGSKKQVHLWQVSMGIPASYNTIWLKILPDDAFCTQLKRAWSFLSLALS